MEYKTFVTRWSKDRIARPDSGASNSSFGDVRHVKNLMRQGYFSDTLTDYGKILMEG